ncbi:hypothetical protein EDB83DRAFT_2576920 [Lactarius deliciosus]|nr:hypothetical protein EDB83DRAFT_2576920 [Lactarius deliciosus]
MSGHAVIDIRNTYGCAFIGLIVSVMLFGITTLQTWIYYWQYGNRDRKALKLFIAVVFLLDALHTTLCIYSVYWYLVLNFGNVEILDTGMWAMGIQVFINTLINYMVQLYYARRVYIGEYYPLPLTGTPSYNLVFSDSLMYALSQVIFGTACLALALVFTVGVTPTTIGLGSRYASLIFTISPSTMYSEIFYWPMSKFYANSLLAMLNSRDYVRERSSTDNKHDNAFDLSSIRIEQRSEGDKSRRPAVSVTVHRSATADFPQSKRDHDVGSRTVENSKLEAGIPSEIHHDGRMSDWNT